MLIKAIFFLSRLVFSSLWNQIFFKYAESYSRFFVPMEKWVSFLVQEDGKHQSPRLELILNNTMQMVYNFN